MICNLRYRFFYLSILGAEAGKRYDKHFLIWRRAEVRGREGGGERAWMSSNWTV